MRFALVNPNWDFTGSIYFGCREAHVPLELLYTAAMVREEGNDALVIDAQTEQLQVPEVRKRIEAFGPDFIVIPSTPSYLFWRCPPPELRVPMEWFAGIGTKAKRVLVGPHGSATPIAAMRKTDAEIIVRGECERAVADLASKDWNSIDGLCWRDQDGVHQNAGLAQVDMRSLGALNFDDYKVEAHSHRHHVFFGEGRGAELEFARGCPWNCTFCNKQLFRNRFRERSVDAVISEIDTLIGRGVDYIYFIDEIFGVGRNVRLLLEAVAKRKLQIGFQTRIDLWDEESIDLLARAHTISVECGVESISEAGREELNKNCKMSTERISELLIYARQRIPWVQANLILTDKDDRGEIQCWQEKLKMHGVWVSEPVPMFPYPGSPLYFETFGAAPDDAAWERAHSHYTNLFQEEDYSDIQEQRPIQLVQLESQPGRSLGRQNFT